MEIVQANGEDYEKKTLAQELKELADWHEAEANYETMDFVNFVACFIENAPAWETEEKPPEGEKVIITRYQPDGKVFVDSAYYIGPVETFNKHEKHEWKTDRTGTEYGDFVWMPLPKPYGGD